MTRPVPLALRASARRLLLLLVVALLTVTMAWAVLATLSARRELLAAKADLAGIRGTTADEVDIPTLRARFATARDRTERARRTLGRPGPAVVARIPLLGRSVAAARDVANAADEVLGAGQDLLDPLAGLDLAGGAVDLAAADRLSSQLEKAAERTRGPLRRLATAPTAGTPPAVGRAVAQARELLTGVDQSFARGAAGVRAGRGLLGADGPRRLVLGIMNNAELRGAGGYIASYAVVTAKGGTLSVSPLRDVNEVHDPPEQAVRVASSPDYSRRWGPFFADTTLWKNVAMSPHVPDSAAVMCRVAALRPGGRCDGVLLLDVPGLSRVMQLAGPVKISGREIGADELVESLLVDAYADVARDPDVAAAQAGRRRVLRSAADRTLEQLLGSSLAAPSALRVLADSARGRHLAVWSADPSEQADLVAAGLSGSADPAGADLSLVSANQFSAGKLDYYVRRRIQIDARVALRTAQVVQRVTFSLDAPRGLPTYVLGTKGGRLEELVDLGLSPRSRNVVLTRNGVPVPADLTRDSGSQRAVVRLDLAAGDSATWELRYDVPLSHGRYALDILPQPLARAADLSLRVRPANGFRLRDVQGPLEKRGPFEFVQRVRVRAEEASWWDRPLRLP